MPDRSERMKSEIATFYTKTGELIREWAEFELILAWAVSALLGTDEFRARVVIGAIRSFEGKRRLILQLSATFAEDATHEELVEIFKRAKNLARNRNMLAHQMGGVAERVNQLVFISDAEDHAIGTNFLSRRIVDQATIEKWIKEAQALRGEIINMFSAGGSATIHRLPKMHRAQRGGQEV